MFQYWKRLCLGVCVFVCVHVCVCRCVFMFASVKQFVQSHSITNWFDIAFDIWSLYAVPVYRHCCLLQKNNPDLVLAFAALSLSQSIDRYRDSSWFDFSLWLYFCLLFLFEQFTLFSWLCVICSEFYERKCTYCIVVECGALHQQTNYSVLIRNHQLKSLINVILHSGPLNGTMYILVIWKRNWICCDLVLCGCANVLECISFDRIFVWIHCHCVSYTMAIFCLQIANNHKRS